MVRWVKNDQHRPPKHPIHTPKTLLQDECNTQNNVFCIVYVCLFTFVAYVVCVVNMYMFVLLPVVRWVKHRSTSTPNTTPKHPNTPRQMRRVHEHFLCLFTYWSFFEVFYNFGRFVFILSCWSFYI